MTIEQIATVLNTPDADILWLLDKGGYHNIECLYFGKEVGWRARLDGQSRHELDKGYTYVWNYIVSGSCSLGAEEVIFQDIAKHPESFRVQGRSAKNKVSMNISFEYLYYRYFNMTLDNLLDANITSYQKMLLKYNTNLSPEVDVWIRLN